MSALEKLGSSLTKAIRRIIRAPLVDEAAVKELVKDFQRTLLQADVNVHLVFDISQKIQKKVLDEKLPPGVSRREHLVKVIFDEFTALVNFYEKQAVERVKKAIKEKRK